MPRTRIDTGRVELRLRPEDKATLTRAAAIERLDLTGYVLRTMLPHAAAVLEREERQELSECDTLRVLALLENPPTPTARLMRAAASAPRDHERPHR